jgi:hypothetical protein
MPWRNRGVRLHDFSPVPPAGIEPATPGLGTCAGGFGYLRPPPNRRVEQLFWHSALGITWWRFALSRGMDAAWGGAVLRPPVASVRPDRLSGSLQDPAAARNRCSQDAREAGRQKRVRGVGKRGSLRGAECDRSHATADRLSRSTKVPAAEGCRNRA